MKVFAIKAITDMLGAPLQPKDFVAYPVISGSSAYMCVGILEDIVVYEAKGWYRSENGKNEPCIRESWKAKIRPVKYNDYRETQKWVKVDGKYQPIPLKNGPRMVTISRVDNLLRVDPPLPEELATEEAVAD